MLSPYALTGATLVANGYSAIPVAPASKTPGAYSSERWGPMFRWPRFCARLPNGYEVPLWERWPDAGVGICCGYGDLLAIDIDTDDHDQTAAVLREIPESPVQKRGAKGRTLFFRGEITSKPFDVSGNRVLDLLGRGKFCVLPGTIHPSGQPYVWLTSDTLINTPLEALPRLENDTAERLAAALAPFGYQPEPEHPQRVASGSGAWADLKQAALARLDLWVPALGLPGTRRTSSGYEAIAAWRGVKNPNLRFHSLGIRDWGSGQPHSPIDVVMHALGMDFPEAAAWLRERVEQPDCFDVAAFAERALAKRRAA